jgi:hypothetical protein
LTSKLKLYLDDCAFSHKLRKLLRDAGHDVQAPANVTPPLTGADDSVHLAHACREGRAILTMNARDFVALHAHDSNHPGILAVYQDNDPSKDMSYAEIVQAVSNLLETVEDVSGEFWALNRYRW